MQFELEPYHRNTSDEELLADLRLIASQHNGRPLTSSLYDKSGKYPLSLIQKRFGSWNKALLRVGLDINNRQDISDEELLEDLRLTASRLGSRSLTRSLHSNGKYSAGTIEKRFGSWNKALLRAGLDICYRKDISSEELLSNLESVWRSLGRQPHKTEFRSPLSKFSCITYQKRFGSWRRALEIFVATVNKDIEEKVEPETPTATAVPETGILKVDTRAINWRTRFLVMRRDGFKCVYCGRSPATSPGVELHIDHIHAWSKGGPTVIGNLQTLCSVCNIGKSDLPASL